MIPTRLFLSGFLSYQDPVELNLEGLELACISGSNGAGKSSILDAITWALFGEARCRDDDALINSHVNAAEVICDFEYETNLYRVQRSKPRGKTTVLEFYVQTPDFTWRTLTEKTVRDTEARIRQILRMDYETFTNASFFLQDRADQFAQQQPANRKKVLSSVLGLEVWETYRAQAQVQRREVEADLRSVEAQVADIDTELAEEQERKQRLAEAEAQLQQVSELSKARESELASLQRLAASLADQKRLLDVLGSRTRETGQRCERLADQIAALHAERAALQARMAQADEIQQAYRQWQVDRDTLEKWDQTAASFHEIQARRAQPLAEIGAAQSRLDEERRGLAAQAESIRLDEQRLATLEQELPAILESIQTVQAGIAERAAFEQELQQLQQQAAALEVENRQLKAEMKALRERLDQLEEVEGALCPLCGQPLAPAERAALIASLESDGKRMGDAYRQNQTNQKQGEDRIRELQTAITGKARLDETLREHNRRHAQAEAEAERLSQSFTAWRAGGAVRLLELDRVIGAEDFAGDARQRLAEIDAAARELGYDPSAHDAARRAEQAGRASEQALRELEAARATWEARERQVAGLETQLAAEQAQQAAQQHEFDAAEQKYQQESADLPDLGQVEREMMELKARENRLRMDLGMVRQLVAVLDTQRERKQRLLEKKAEQAVRISRLKALELTFSKDGMPSLLIEQALPEIEEQANGLLDRLSGGGMSVRFETQRQLKNKDEKRETLDIKITDASGQTREYEMFSGGEAFRINFAIRLALSRVLAHRAGARLQTLFIDEGFGSQDAEGRQRLLEAINMVRPEFARILVITHMEELKDAFPARIEVEKTLRGSNIRIVT